MDTATTSRIKAERPAITPASQAGVADVVVVTVVVVPTQ